MCKTRKYVMLSTIITALCLTFIVVGSKPVQAKTYYTTQYSITSAFENFEAVSANGCLSVHITINFTDYYTGSMRIGLTNTYNVDYNFIMYNAKLTAKSTSYFTISFNQVKNIDIYLVLKASDYYGSIGTTAAAIANYFVGNWSSIFDINTVNNVSISVDNPTDDIIDLISSVDTDLDNLSTISSQLTTINNTLLNMNGIGSSGGSSYSWHSYQLQYVAMLAKMGVTWDSSVLNSLYVANGLSSFNQNRGTNQFYINPNSTLHIIHLSNSGGAYYVKQNATTYTDLLDNITSDVVNAYGSSGIVLNHITITNNTNSTVTGYFWRANTTQWIYPIFWGYVVPDEVLALLGKDTTTNTLLSDILEAMSNINITVENNQEINNVVNNKNSIITNITNNHNTVNNITNDFNLDFDTADNAITLDIDSMPNLTNTATFWNGKAGDLDVELGDFHYPIWLGFVLLAIMAMIGV